MSNASAELQKEFELERMILFSDAVFAIAITLLIIEIKFPDVEKGATTQQIMQAFRPTLIRFSGFILSFFFIGLMWARHLRLCRYLRAYNNGLIFCNLVLLFFIVCFPFTASGITEHINPKFFLPLFIYIGNIAFVTFAQFAFCYYIFSLKPNLSVKGFEAQKKYLLLQSKHSALILLIIVVVEVALSFIFPGNYRYMLYGFYLMPIMVAVNRRKLKKYKPVGEDI